MLIRSQDKKSITTDLNLEIFADETKNEYAIGNITRGGIGTYSTEEKAIKVLDMIENFYSNFKFCEIWGSDMTEFYDAIFQMPQDEEVKV